MIIIPLTYLGFNLLPNCSKSGSSVDVLLVHHLRDIRLNERLAMNEPPKNVLLQSWPVVADILPFFHLKGVLTVKENDGGKLSLIVEQVAAMDVRERYRIALPCYLGLAVEDERKSKALKTHSHAMSHKFRVSYVGGVGQGLGIPPPLSLQGFDTQCLLVGFQKPVTS